MHKDCIVLCHDTDGDGNLLCLKEINGKPFITYLATYLRKFHICKVIFSISEKKEDFKEYILSNREDFSFSFDFAEQEKNIGSGRAIHHALHYSDTPDVLIMNAHCYFDVNLDDLIAWQQTKMGDVTMALAYQQNTLNYTIAHLDEKNTVHEFNDGLEEKAGLIISGLFCMFRPSFLNINFPNEFSFIDDYLLKHNKERDLIGMISEGSFIDLAQEGAEEKAIKDFPDIFATQTTSNDKN